MQPLNSWSLKEEGGEGIDSHASETCFPTEPVTTLSRFARCKAMSITAWEQGKEQCCSGKCCHGNLYKRIQRPVFSINKTKTIAYLRHYAALYFWVVWIQCRGHLWIDYFWQYWVFLLFVVAVDVYSGQSHGTLFLFEYSKCKQGTAAENWLDKSNCPEY